MNVIPVPSVTDEYSASIDMPLYRSGVKSIVGTCVDLSQLELTVMMEISFESLLSLTVV